MRGGRWCGGRAADTGCGCRASARPGLGARQLRGGGAARGHGQRAGLPLAAIDRLEINEAQGAQLLAVQRSLELDPARLNVHGGAIALGHPLAATGLRLAITLARQLRAEGLRYGVAAVCIGGGQGMAVLLENPGWRER
ncbi:acetyl-CoA acetyltransferase [Pseudomonas psychrotolerans]|uniref:Acetyl-CoA acetyltransferase n=1 Tax=Pseudomonas oryzihabitans TaxID=47885 RepID=A0AAJ2BQM6_9PSED|nr:acetyl-CoA acetyltransferase [Pseudomonas psychrotolerans]MDR6356259.1 acetyl-CoA acetyltransferase [Pseudomonas psychrotolerans]